MYRAELESSFSGPGAEFLDVRYIEHELGDGLTTLAAAAQRVKHDVASGSRGGFQLDDSIPFGPVDPEAEVARVEFGDGFHVAHVEQNLAQDGRRRVCPVPLGHWPCVCSVVNTFTIPASLGEPGISDWRLESGAARGLRRGQAARAGPTSAPPAARQRSSRAAFSASASATARALT